MGKLWTNGGGLCADTGKVVACASAPTPVCGLDCCNNPVTNCFENPIGSTRMTLSFNWFGFVDALVPISGGGSSIQRLTMNGNHQFFLANQNPAPIPGLPCADAIRFSESVERMTTGGLGNSKFEIGHNRLYRVTANVSASSTGFWIVDLHFIFLWLVHSAIAPDATLDAPCLGTTIDISPDDPLATDLFFSFNSLFRWTSAGRPVSFLCDPFKPFITPCSVLVRNPTLLPGIRLQLVLGYDAAASGFTNQWKSCP